MPKDVSIGLVVPFATDAVPDEGLQMYPGVRFVPRGVGVRSLTPTGYDSACDAILPAAEYLAKQDVDAIMVIGTSLTFYRGSDFHDRLMDDLRRATGLPCSLHAFVMLLFYIARVFCVLIHFSMLLSWDSVSVQPEDNQIPGNVGKIHSGYFADLRILDEKRSMVSGLRSECIRLNFQVN